MESAATEPFLLTLLSTDPAWIEAADGAGVQRIGVDIERLGKAERQRAVADARISGHKLEDLLHVTARVKQARPFARLNGLHAGTGEEVEQALGYGAASLMLPYFRSAREAGRFVDLVAGRAEVILLVETATAMARLPEIVALPGVSEIMIGMNDLHLELGLASPMEIAASDLLAWLAGVVRGAGLRFGYGGIAPPDAAGLPASPDLLLARSVQLGAGSAWVARSFFRGGLTPAEFGPALARWRERRAHWQTRPDGERDLALAALRREVGTLKTP
jgi:hypothetical protein